VAGSTGSALSPEGRRAVRDVVLARLISSAGVEASFFVGLWGKAAFELDGTAGQLAVMSALIAVGAMVGSLVGGAAVDRLDARRVLIAAEVVFVPTTLSLMWADTMPALLALGFLSWMTGGALETALVSLPPALVSDADLEPANARLESANWLALVIGPGIGALIARFVGLDAIFLFDAITSVVALVLIRRVVLPPRQAAPPAHGTGGVDGGAEVPTTPSTSAGAGAGLADVWGGLRLAAGNPAIRLALGLAGLVSIAFGVFVALEPLYYRDVLGTGVEAIGYVNAVFGVGLFAGSIALERTRGRWTGFRAAIALTVAAGLGSAVYVGTGSLRWVVVGAVLWSVPLGASLPMTRTLLQRASDPAYVGRVMGALGVVQQAAGLLPLAVAPALAARLGVQAVLLGAGLSAAVIAPLALRAAGRLDHAARHTTGQPTTGQPTTGQPPTGQSTMTLSPDSSTSTASSADQTPPSTR
jgi:DHA3 family macrolide efflux protein-like MFS transporter